AIAFTSSLVVGVWIGDPPGNAQVGLVGVDTAAPIALELASELAKGAESALWGAPAPLARDGAVAERPVCAVSGFPPGKLCPRPVLGHFPTGAPPPPPCAVHREVLVDSAGVEVCRACAGARSVTHRVVEAWPPEVEQWLHHNGLRSAGSGLLLTHPP